MRDRLIKLILNADCDDNLRCYDIYDITDTKSCGAEYFADYLLANGVIVPPCKVGDVVYCCGRDKVEGFVVLSIELAFTADGFEGEFVANNGEYPLLFGFENVGKTVFLAREEAERALKGGVE